MNITLDEKDVRDYKYRVEQAFRKHNAKVFSELLDVSRYSDSAKNDLRRRYDESMSKLELPKLVEI